MGEQLKEEKKKPVQAQTAGRKRTELEILIRARYPLIYVVSWEEQRVMAEVERIAHLLGKKVYEWTISNGISRYHSGLGTVEGKKGTKDPILALKEISEINEPCIFCLKDFHAFIKDNIVVRSLRDLAITLRHTYTSVILLSPILEIPPELEKEITIVDFPLPTKDDLMELLNQIATEIKNNPNFQLDLSPPSRDRILDAAIGLTLNEAENVFAKTLVTTGRLTATEVPLIYSEKKQIIRKSGILDYIEPEENIDSVGGLKNLKEWLSKRRLAFSERARAFGLPVPKGVLFIGVQGCGKSLCAKAVSNFWSLPLLRMDTGKLFSSFVGSSELNVRRAISIAESISPVILWIDELDKAFAGLQSSSFSDSGTTARVFGTLITWLQEKDMPVFVIATANDIEVLPPELLRKGRFDEIFFVDLPDLEERKEIFAIHLRKRNRDPNDFDLETLAKASEGFSGAEIEQAVISALYDAFEQETDIDTELILNAIRQTYPLSATMKEKIEATRRWALGRTRPAS